MTLERQGYEPRRERIPQPQFDNMLSFIGNHEAKAVLFRAMVPGQPYSKGGLGTLMLRL